MVLAFGASQDKLLQVPGEGSLRSILGAKEWVGWYNGDPAHRHLALPPLDQCETAVIVGQGMRDLRRVCLDGGMAS